MTFKISNEQGVIVYFAQECSKHGWDIDWIGTGFPDAGLIYRPTQLPVRAEFEYEALNFAYHGHDATECELIVCWLNNWPQCPMPVVELSDPNWITFVPAEANIFERRLRKLETENEFLRQQLSTRTTYSHRDELTPEEIYNFCKIGDENGFSRVRMNRVARFSRLEWERRMMKLRDIGAVKARPRSPTRWVQGWDPERVRQELSTLD